MKLRMASVDREREKNQSPQNSVKFQSLQRAHHNIFNGVNESSNGFTNQTIFVVNILVNLTLSTSVLLMLASIPIISSSVQCTWHKHRVTCVMMMSA
jgi:hypothetical protein